MWTTVAGGLGYYSDKCQWRIYDWSRVEWNFAHAFGLFRLYSVSRRLEPTCGVLWARFARYLELIGCRIEGSKYLLLRCHEIDGTSLERDLTSNLIIALYVDISKILQKFFNSQYKLNIWTFYRLYYKTSAKKMLILRVYEQKVTTQHNKTVEQLFAVL